MKMQSVPNYSPRTKKVLLIFFSIGILMLAGSGLEAFATHRFLKTVITSEGQVVRLIAHPKALRQTVYHPVVEFRARDSKLYSFQSPMESSFETYFVGKTVKILYSPYYHEASRI